VKELAFDFTVSTVMLIFKIEPPSVWLAATLRMDRKR
jgi:hypothetical protein